MAGQPGFFDLDQRLGQLSSGGDPLERLSAVVDFDLFRKPLVKALKRSDRSKGGRPPYDAVLMFKVLVLQALYNLSDDGCEYQIRDRLSFMRFLGLGLEDATPDAKTIWLFREHLIQAGAVDKLFARFDKHLARAGYLAMGGQIIDASIISAPKQRNTDGERVDIKAGRVPRAWKDKPAKLAQKDRDARWTLKRGRRKVDAQGKPYPEIAVPDFGYKNHISTDRAHGLIRRYQVSDAAHNDGRMLPRLLDKANTASDVWADTAYRSKRNERHLAQNGFVSRVHTKKPRGRPRSGRQFKANAARSKVRSRVEHVFGEQKARMGLFVRTIGLVRARTKIGMANLVYNMKRLVWLEGRTAPA